VTIPRVRGLRRGVAAGAPADDSVWEIGLIAPFLTLGARENPFEPPPESTVDSIAAGTTLRGVVGV